MTEVLIRRSDNVIAVSVSCDVCEGTLMVGEYEPLFSAAGLGPRATWMRVVEKRVEAMLLFASLGGVIEERGFFCPACREHVLK